MKNTNTLFIVQQRTYHAKFTQSELFLPELSKASHQFFCYCLEDIARPSGLKFAGETCIPEGIYDVTVSYSPRFEKEMILLSNTQQESVRKNGIEFTGIRVHGGNTVADTDGCILAAYKTDNAGTISQRASDDLKDRCKAWIKQGYKIKWVIGA